MPVVNTLQNFATGDTVTSTSLNNIMDQSVFIAGAVVTGDGLTVTAGGQMTIENLKVTGSKIGDLEVSTAKIANDAITTAKIANDSITTAKIGSDAVTQAKLADDSVGSDQIIDASVKASMLDGAQSGSAPIYGVRAWANFDGRFTQVTGKAYTRSGTTVTVTNAGHGLSTGNILSISSATDTGLNTANNVTASVKITVVDANSFTFQTASTGTTTGTLTYAIGIYSSGNVLSIARIATGQWTITFSTAMNDANYCVLANAKHATGVNVFTNTWPTSFTSTTFNLNVMRDAGVDYNSEYISFVVMK